MDNVFDLGISPYEAAPILCKAANKSHYWKQFCIFFLFTCDIIKVTVLSVPVVIKLIVRLFYSTKKCVAGQTVLVTGGGNGLGRELALQLAAEKCSVAVVDLDYEAAQKTVNDIKEIHKVEAIAYKTDIADSDAVKELYHKIKRDFGPLDILINNAGILPALSLHEGTEAEIDRIIKINISSHIYTLRTFLPDMIAQKRGHIVAISSLSALHPLSGAIVYSATKSAIHSLMHGLYEDLRQNDQTQYINLTCIHPFFLNTRKDLMDKMKIRPFLRPLNPRKAAAIAIDSILRNEFMVLLPKITSFMYIVLYLPYEVQELFRDYVYRERESAIYFKSKTKMNKNVESE